MLVPKPRYSKEEFGRRGGFLPADSMHKFGQGVSVLGMLAACCADLADSVCQIHDHCCHSRVGGHDE